MKHFISLGAGVQSSTMALMAAHGEITPMPDAAIFADTQAEPSSVYQWLNRLESLLPFPVYRVSAGSLRQQIVLAMKGEARMDARPPFFVGSGGMLNRQCTEDYKLRPIQKKVRELAGIKPKSRGPKDIAVEQWIGISFDELDRMKGSQFRWLRLSYPLVERRITRTDCLRWLNIHDYPEPPKSACTFCPYHNDAMWREMKLSDPESFLDAVEIDKIIRPGVGTQKSNWFIHRSLVPLSEVKFANAEDLGQYNLFRNECEGMCGV